MSLVAEMITQMHKISRNLSLSIMTKVLGLKRKDFDDMMQFPQFCRPFSKSVYHGAESISLLGSKI